MKTWLLLVLTLTGCGNECDFFERCDGPVRELCGEGVDQVINRKIRREPCEAPNEACVQLSRQRTACVASPATPCTSTSCSGTTLLGCLHFADGGFVTQERCGDDGGTCVSDGGAAVCR